MRSDIEIITLSEKFDFGEIIDLIREEWPAELGEKSDAELMQGMVDSHNASTDTMKLLRDARGTDVAFLRYTTWPRDAVRTRTIHLLDIVVDRRVRRTGLGAVLMQDMLAECRKKEIRWIISRTFTSNAASIGLHKRFGFEFDFETDDSIVWRKTLE